MRELSPFWFSTHICTGALLTLAAPPTLAGTCAPAIPDITTSFVFGSTNAIGAASRTITPNCSGNGDKSYLFMYSANNASNTAGSGIAKLSTNANKTINYRIQKSLSSTLSAWGTTSGNYLFIDNTSTSIGYVVDGLQDTSFPQAGTYEDTLSISNSGNQNNAGNPPFITPAPKVSITVPEQCDLAWVSGKSNLQLTYTSFGPTQADSITLNIRCNYKYQIGLSANNSPTSATTLTDALLGLTYTLNATGAALTSGGPQSATADPLTISASIQSGGSGTYPCAPPTPRAACSSLTDSKTYYVVITPQ